MTTHASPLPSLTATLPDPSYQQLRMLRRQIRHRTAITLLEQVARDVGGTVYAEFLPQLRESTTYLRRGRIAGRTYVNLLSMSIRRRPADMSIIVVS